MFPLANSATIPAPTNKLTIPRRLGLKGNMTHCTPITENAPEPSSSRILQPKPSLVFAVSSSLAILAQVKLYRRSGQDRLEQERCSSSVRVKDAFQHERAALGEAAHLLATGLRSQVMT
jgi:hypothetical protein